MRIEISSGGISGLMSVGNFLSDMKGFDGSINNVISSFKTIENETASLVGGVGNLGGAVDAVATRLTKEESKKNSAAEVLRKTNDFIGLAECVDRQVAAMVEINKNAFYLVHPWLRPPAPPRKKGLLQQAWGYLCGAGDAVVDGFKGAWNWTTGQLKKVCDNLVEFYKKHKKFFDTIAVVGLSTLAVVAVVGSGGTALTPLLVNLGFSSGTAGAVSTFIGGVAVVSTIGSGTMNVADVWFDIDDPTFNSIQKAFNVVSATSNITYSVGTLYNSIFRVTPDKYVYGSAEKRIIPGKEGVVTGGDSTQLGKNMMESYNIPKSTKWSGHQAQHIIPAEMKEHPVLQKIGMDMDDASNGLFLRTPANDISAMSRHSGYHSVYNEFVKIQLDQMNINQSVYLLQQQVFELQSKLRVLQQNGLPLYPGQGATVDLWVKWINKI